jgi:hypothetical protein
LPPGWICKLAAFILQFFADTKLRRMHMNERRFVSLTGRVPGAPRGQGLVEVALILAILVIVMVISLTLLGVNLRQAYNCVVDSLRTGGPCNQYCSDNFTDLEGWSSQNGWQSNNGMMCNASTGESRNYNSCSSSSIPADYTVNLQVAQLYQGNGYGILFRIQSQSPLNAYSFQYDPGLNAFVFRKWVNGVELAAPFAMAPVPPGYNWYNQARSVRVVAHGNHFQAYMDNSLVLEATENTFPSGSVGLRTWDSTQACFGKFSIGP